MSGATNTMDPALLAVLVNRFDAIVREMTNTLLRTGRSTVMSVARDFSCAIVTADDELLSSAEALPVHVFGTHLQTAAMRRMHPGFAEGDAYLDNDPYIGNTHHADHTILVPVFIGGEHVFTAAAKAHQADTGNSIPSTYHPLAKDIYEEGALCFSMTQVQRDYTDIDDVIRMCRRRIRVPDQWYGDYLAMLGAARIAERRLKQAAERYGVDTLREFVGEWLDYSERRMRAAIAKLPAAAVEGEGAHDPFGPLTEGVPVKVKVAVDPEAGTVEVDLRDNIDCVPAGINQSEACAINNAITGVLNVVGSGVPVNSGTFRRITVRLRENCVVGIPLHPTCCSMATTNLADRIINITQHAFSELGDGYGLAQGGAVTGAGFSVVAGQDPRTGGGYINQLIVGTNGGPATPRTDGWVTYNAPCGAGLVYRDSIELNELKYPVLFRHLRIAVDSGGAGRRRGAVSTTVEFGPREAPMTAAFNIDGHERPARGARGGGDGSLGAAYLIGADGTRTRTEPMAQIELRPGERLYGEHGGGGGYGPPTEREPARVLHDHLEGYVSREAAEGVYGVVFTGAAEDGTLAVDEDATRARRAAR